MAVCTKRYRFDVDQYVQMARIGIIGPDRRTELLDGRIFDVSPQGSRHRGMIAHVGSVLYRYFDDAAVIIPQSTLILRPDSAPEPDFTLLRRRDDLYMQDEERPADVLLVIEVADSSLRFDRAVKSRVYALHGVGEYWIVDVNARRVLVYREPAASGYRSMTTWGAGGLSPLAFPERSVPYGELFAPLLPKGPSQAS
jgi:Uma2 family endonuclease